jgi:hypothetical protein
LSNLRSAQALKLIMKKKLAPLIVVLVFSGSCSVEKVHQMKQTQKRTEFEQIDFDDLAKLYMTKKIGENELEGIYSVSHMIVRRAKGFLSSVEKEKVVDRKENFGRVAIFSDQGKSARDFFEVPLTDSRQLSHSIRGEFIKAAEGNILIYKHFEPRKKVLTYTFTYDEEKNLLEGIRTENNGNAVITYTLTYIKLFPKSDFEPRAKN